MIKVIKPTNRIPSSLKKCDSKISKVLIEKGKHKFSGYANDDVKNKLSKIYNNKCAFCEFDTTAGAVLQVEHYRPKAKVKEEPSHNGYYWLGYEWTNLLFACSRCNRAKSTHFPIDVAGVRVFSHPIKNGNLDKIKCKANNVDLIN